MKENLDICKAIFLYYDGSLHNVALCFSYCGYISSWWITATLNPYSSRCIFAPYDCSGGSESILQGIITGETHDVIET